MEEDYAGFFQGVKEVLKATRENIARELKEQLRSLLQVPKRISKRRLKRHLGAPLQHIVIGI